MEHEISRKYELGSLKPCVFGQDYQVPNPWNAMGYGFWYPASWRLLEVTCVLSNKLKLRCPLSFERVRSPSESFIWIHRTPTFAAFSMDQDLNPIPSAIQVDIPVRGETCMCPWLTFFTARRCMSHESDTSRGTQSLRWSFFFCAKMGFSSSLWSQTVCARVAIYNLFINYNISSIFLQSLFFSHFKFLLTYPWPPKLWRLTMGTYSGLSCLSLDPKNFAWRYDVDGRSYGCNFLVSQAQFLGPRKVRE